MFCQRAWSYQKGYKQHFNECWHSSIHPPIHPSNHPSNHSFINPSIHLHAIHFVLTWRNWPFPEIKYSTFLSFCCSAAVSGSELCAGRLCWSHQIVKKKDTLPGEVWYYWDAADFYVWKYKQSAKPVSSNLALKTLLALSTSTSGIWQALKKHIVYVIDIFIKKHEGYQL